jgi:hypothetical protein
MSKPSQIIDAPHVDQRKLIRLLKEMYGENEGKDNFRVELRLNRYKIYALDDAPPRPLTEDQIRDLQARRRR